MFLTDDVHQSRGRLALLLNDHGLVLGYGRFLETDPLGYEDGLNWYNYVGGDPVNLVDPTGLSCADGTSGSNAADCAGHGGYVAGTPRDQPQGREVTVTARLPGLHAGDVRGVNLPGVASVDIVALGPQKVDPCSVVAGQTGGIKYSGTAVSLVLLGGITRTSGTFTNVRTGSTGHFISYGVSLGLGIGAGRTSGYYGSISNFLGYSETLEGSASLFGSALSANAFVTQNANNDITAGGAGVSVGAPLPLPAWANRAAATATASDTSISGCKVGPRQ